MVKNPPANAGDMRLQCDPWVRKIPWRSDRLPIPVLLGFLVAQCTPISGRRTLTLRPQMASDVASGGKDSEKSFCFH